MIASGLTTFVDYSNPDITPAAFPGKISCTTSCGTRLTLLLDTALYFSSVRVLNSLESLFVLGVAIAPSPALAA